MCGRGKHCIVYKGAPQGGSSSAMLPRASSTPPRTAIVRECAASAPARPRLTWGGGGSGRALGRPQHHARDAASRRAASRACMAGIGDCSARGGPSWSHPSHPARPPRTGPQALWAAVEEEKGPLLLSVSARRSKLVRGGVLAVPRRFRTPQPPRDGCRSPAHSSSLQPRQQSSKQACLCTGQARWLNGGTLPRRCRGQGETCTRLPEAPPRRALLGEGAHSLPLHSFPFCRLAGGWQGNRVAIKVVNPERVSDEARVALYAEAVTMSQLQHPYIARVFGEQSAAHASGAPPRESGGRASPCRAGAGATLRARHGLLGLAFCGPQLARRRGG